MCLFLVFIAFKNHFCTFFDRFGHIFRPFSEVRIFRRGFGEAWGAARPRPPRGVAAAALRRRRRRGAAAAAEFSVLFLANVRYMPFPNMPARGGNSNPASTTWRTAKAEVP